MSDENEGGTARTSNRTTDAVRKADPVLVAVTAAGIALGAMKTFVSHLLLPPFWEDAIVAVLLFASSSYWLLELVGSLSAKAPRRRHSHSAGLKDTVGFGALLAIQTGLCIWFLYPPVALIVGPRWTLCGTFAIENPQGACLIAYDGRGREISDTCSEFDQSGWIRKSGEHWWFYRPRSVAIRRAGVVGQRFAPAAILFLPTCEGVIYPK